MNLFAEVERLSRLIDKGCDALREAGRELAQAEHDYRLARAMAWQRTEGTAKQREDHVNALTAPDRLRRDLAEGQTKFELGDRVWIDNPSSRDHGGSGTVVALVGRFPVMYAIRLDAAPDLTPAYHAGELRHEGGEA